MESSQKWDLPIFKAFIYNGEIEGHPGPKKKNKKYKLAPDPKRRKNIFFIGYILYPFWPKVPAKCPLFETNQRYAPILKHDLHKMEFQCKTRFLENRVTAKSNIYIYIVKLEFHLKVFKELEFIKLEFYTKTWFS